MGQPEDPRDNELELLVSDEGALLLGPEAALAQLSDTESAAAPRAVSPTALRRARQAWGATRGALEGAARGAIEGASKGAADAGSSGAHGANER